MTQQSFNPQQDFKQMADERLETTRQIVDGCREAMSVAMGANMRFAESVIDMKMAYLTALQGFIQRAPTIVKVMNEAMGDVITATADQRRRRD